MKKSIFYSLLAASILSCSTKNTNYLNRKYHSFTAYYNALFNGKEAMGTELEQREKNHKENYYKDYIQVLGFEELDPKKENQTKPDSDEGPSIFGGESPASGSNASNKPLTPLDITILKAQKVISKKSIIKDGLERNNTVFDAYILLIRAYLYQNQDMEALETCDKAILLYKKDPKLPLIKIYKALALTKLNNEYQSKEIYVELLKDKELKKEYKQLMSIHYAEYLLKINQPEDCAHALDTAFALNSDSRIKSRIAYLKGQVLSKLGHTADAKQSFKQAFDLADNFEFETKSQLQMAYNFNPKEDNYEASILHFDNLAKVGTYGSKKNEFLFAQGIIAKKANKKDEALDFFRKSIKEKASDAQIRGLAYAEMAKYAHADEDYIKANKLYDSAVAKLTYEPSQLQFKLLAKQTKDIAGNLTLMKKNDSVMALCAMPKAERDTYLKKYISDLKAKEEKIAAEKERAQLNKAFANSTVGSNNQNSIFGQQNPGTLSSQSTGSGFYFANKNIVSQGQQEFKQLWGDRSSEGYWRANTNSVFNGGYVEPAKSTPSNTRRYDVNYYLEQLPKDSASIGQLKYARDSAQLGLGRMYDKYFNLKDKATKNWYDLVELKPEDKIKQQALLLIFKMHYESNPSACERAKQIIIETWPNSEIAAYVQNPQSASFSKASPEASQKFEAAYTLYTEQKFDEAKALLPEIITQYPKDVIVPKVRLLDSFIFAKKQDKINYAKGLEQIILSYPETQEGLLAKKLLDQLKAEKAAQPSQPQPSTPQPQSPEPQNDGPEQDLGPNKAPIAAPSSSTPPKPVLSPGPIKQNTPKGSSTVPNLSTMPQVP